MRSYIHVRNLHRRHRHLLAIINEVLTLERDKEAVVAGRRATQGNQNSATAWRTLAAALALNGQPDEAHAAMRRLLTIDPTCTLTSMANRQGYSDKAKARYFDGMRRAGLPE